MCFFSVTKHQIVYVAIVFNLVYTCLTSGRGFSLSGRPLQTGESGGTLSTIPGTTRTVLSAQKVLSAF